VLQNKLKILDIEIFELHRTIDSLKRDLTYTTFNLSNILLDHIWNSIQKHHILAFRRCNTRMFLIHKKKFEWLLHKRVQKNMEVKPIKFSCITNKNTHTKLLKFNDNDPFTTANETLTKVNLIPFCFLIKSITYLTHQPKMVQKSLQHRYSPRRLESTANERYVYTP